MTRTMENNSWFGVGVERDGNMCVLVFYGTGKAFSTKAMIFAQKPEGSE